MRRNVRGFTLLELIVAMTLVVTFVVFIGAHVLSMNKSSTILKDSNLMNQIAEDIARRFANQNIKESKKGTVIMTEAGIRIDEKDTASKEQTYFYTATVNTVNNDYMYVLVTLRSNQQVSVSSTAMYKK